MIFNKIKYNKKFDKDYFELNKLLNKQKTNNNTSNNTTGTSTTNSGTSSTITEQNNTTGTSTTNSSTITDNTSNNTTGTNTTSNNTSTESNTNTNSGTSTANSGTSTTNSSTSTTSDTTQGTKKTATIKDVLYPMYLPDNTYLTNQETVDTLNGKRLILTFGGDSSFVLVEETASYSDEAMVIPVSGEFDFLSDVIGVINNNSITWQTGGIEYYITSDTIKTSELLDIARSISVLPVSK